MATSTPALNVGFGTPFQAQIDYLRNKLRLPTERWDDIQRSAHDRAFIVAGAAKADLLADLHRAVTDTATKGTGLEAFRRDFKAIVAKHGWTGWTGEGSSGGEAWRTRVIYQTNMATSYAAGRYQQMTDPDVLNLHPYWRYIHSDGVQHPRPLHLSWHGITLLHNHPFWKTHFCPNGWGCQCRIISVSKAEGLRSAKAGLGDPPEGWDQIDPRTGAQVGIDKGFDYTPGAATDTPLRQFVQDKLITYPDAIASALSRDVNRYINATERASRFAARMQVDRANVEPLWVGFVENPQDVSRLIGHDVSGYTLLIPSDTPRHVEKSHRNDGGTQRAPQPADFDQVATVLNAADELRAGDLSRKNNATVVATRNIDGEIYRAVFEVLTGKKNRSLSLQSLLIKTKK
ncbi:MAG: phage minor head protein [Rhodoferax sp.]|nr:phage minor head protein [Rhodoferax sp.]